MIHRSNPPDLHPPPGYHHVVIADAGRLVFLAGQCPLDREGHLVGPDDLLTQVAQVAANIRTALSAAELTPDDVVRTVIYVVTTDRNELVSVWAALRASPVAAMLSSASTLLGVSLLGYPGQRIEIDVTATSTG